jgi:hypothetical protein
MQEDHDSIAHAMLLYRMRAVSGRSVAADRRQRYAVPGAQCRLTGTIPSFPSLPSALPVTRLPDVPPMTNALYTIRPYRMGSVRAFDDPARGLQAEPLVAGMPEMINRVMTLQRLEGDHVTIVFSDRPFPGALHLTKTRPEDAGAWYRLSEPFEAEGWLCPAMLRYFPEHPQDVYATISA